MLIFSLDASGQSITFSELNYNSDSTTNSGNWVELYNYGTTSLDLTGWYLKDDDDANVFVIPAGTQLAAAGKLVLVNDIAKFTSQFPIVTNFIGELTFSFGNDSDQVRLFDNTGALKVSMAYTDTLPWPSAAADGTGRTLELSDTNISPGDPSNWFVGCMKGSPGKAFTPCADNLVFSEINYNSDTLLDAGDWVELHNISAGGVNLTGWSFKDDHDDNTYFFPSGLQIPSSGYLVLIHDTTKFKARHPSVTNYVGPFAFNLSNDGELIRLYNSQGKLAFSILYDDDGDWPAGADGDTYTLELLSPSSNMNSPSDWFTGCPEGSPGVVYDPDCSVGIEDVNHSSPVINTQYADQTLTVTMDELQQAVRMAVLNTVGQQVYATSFSGNNKSIDTRFLSRGMYILWLSNEQFSWSEKFIVR
jgi:hypothetical protein